VINTPATKNILRALPFAIAANAIFFPSPIVATAQPVGQHKLQPTNLTFDVSARIGSTGADGKTSGPQQSFNAKVLISGKKARIETGQGQQKTVLLFSNPYIYRLLPTSKAGIRWQLDAKKGATFRDFNPQQLLSNPAGIRASLVNNGAKKTGNTKLNGQDVEIYEVNKPGGRFDFAKAWIGRDNALPYKLEAKGQGMGVVASWKNYARPKIISPALFTAPANFHIRNVQSPPPLSGM